MSCSYVFNVNQIFSKLLLSIALVFLAGCSNATSPNSGFDIGEHAGKWVVMNYWAEWCVPCIKEIPELNALHHNNGNSVKVLGVNFDGLKGEELEAASEKFNIEFEELENDPADILKLSRPEGLPTTYIFNDKGKLAAKLVGPQTEASLLERIEKLKNSDI